MRKVYSFKTWVLHVILSKKDKMVYLFKNQSIETFKGIQLIYSFKTGGIDTFEGKQYVYSSKI